jgi:hypothetical protein
MFRLLKEGGRLHAISRDVEGGKKSLRFDVNTALRFLFYLSGGLRRHRPENILKLLHIRETRLGP